MRSRDHWVTQSIRSIGTLGCPSTWLQRYRTLFIFDPHFLVPMEFSAVLEIAVELTLLLVHFMMDDDHHLDLDRMSQVETVASDSPLKPKLVWTQLPQFLLRRPLTVLDHLEYVHGLLPEATTGLYTLHNLAKYVDVHLSCKLMGHLRSHSSKKGGHWDGLRDLDERTDGRLEFCNSMWCHVISSSLGDTADGLRDLDERTDGRLEFCNSMWCHVISSSLGDGRHGRCEIWTEPPREKRRCFVRGRLQICDVVSLLYLGCFCPGWICGYLDSMMRICVRPPHTSGCFILYMMRRGLKDQGMSNM